MKAKLTIFLLMFCAVLGASAQKYTVTGRIFDDTEKQPLELVAVQLIAGGKNVTGTFTDSLGHFTLKTDHKGSFTLHASYVGCDALNKDVRLGGQQNQVALDSLFLHVVDRELEQAVVTATLARVEQQADTTVYNAGAYHVPDGATLEALVKQFPGIEVTDDGKIKWNGKEIKEFLINGKDFFKGETDIAMKNLPVNMVSKVRAYNKKSDYAEQTGIDDGEETTVFDIMTRRELNQSLVSNIDLATGWDWNDHWLYSGKIFATRFTDQSRVTAFASRNNVGDNGFGGPRGMGGGGGGNGITTSTMAGFDFNWDNGRKRFEAGRVEVGGNVNYRGRNNETESTSSSETFMTNSKGKSYSNSHSWGTSVSHNIGASLRFMWSPDSLTAFSFRPNYSWSRGENSSRSRSANFDEDPFDRIAGAENTDDVLDALNWIYERPTYGELTDLEQQKYQTDYAWLVNLNNRRSFSENQSHNVSGNLNLTRRLTGKQGRNISLQASAGWSKSESWSYSLSNIYTRQNNGSGDNTFNPNGTHKYTLSPSVNWNASVGGSYVEPLVGKWFGELRYNYSHRFQDTDKTDYDLYDLSPANVAAIVDKYTGKAPFQTGLYYREPDGVGTLTGVQDISTTDLLNDFLTMDHGNALAAMRDKENSRYSTYKYDNQRISAGVRYNTQDINFNASVSFNPEHTTLHYDRPALAAIDTTRTVFTVSPQVRFRYNFSKTDRLDFNYRGNSSQPSMTQLLPVADNSNPLNISAGNPGLAPSWSDSFRLSFNGYNTERQAGTQVNLNASINQRSITTRQITDELTGVRYSRPENISGNWSTSGGFHYNIGLGKQKLFTVSTGTDVSYDTSVGYSSSKPVGIAPQADGETTMAFMDRLFSAVDNVRTKSQSTRVNENLNLAFRQTYWDISANGRMNYMHSVSNAQNAQTMNTWGFAYGLSGNVHLDCGFAFSTDIRMNSRRGYSEKTMNTNELIWNAQISQSFLKGKALTLQLQFYDILQQQSNISRTVTALSRSDSWNDAINSYVMLHAIYKLNVFAGGSSKGDEGPRGDRPPMDGPGQGGPGYGSGRPGGNGEGPGYGGGRPSGRPGGYGDMPGGGPGGRPM